MLLMLYKYSKKIILLDIIQLQNTISMYKMGNKTLSFSVKQKHLQRNIYKFLSISSSHVNGFNFIGLYYIATQECLSLFNAIIKYF